jgi:C_GCAxxG_C_C family probable redox protein
MSKKQQLAEEIFSQQFNCAQSSLAPFAEELGMDKETALKLCSGFGGGAARGELCGAVTGSLLALGLKQGHITPNDPDSKAKGYELPKEFLARFEEQFGSVRCKELLGMDPSNELEKEKIKALGLFESKCPVLVKQAVAITEELLKETD